MAGGDTTNYNFHITNGGSQSGEGQTPQEEAANLGNIDTTNPVTPQNTVKTVITTQMLMDLAKQTVNSVTSNIGEFTGNHRLQSQINTVKKATQTAMFIALDPSPFKIASIGATTINAGIDAAMYFLELKRERKQNEYDFRRTGLTAYRNI